MCIKFNYLTEETFITFIKFRAKKIRKKQKEILRKSCGLSFFKQFLLFLIVSLLTEVWKIVAVGYLIVHVNFHINFFLLLYHPCFLWSFWFTFKFCFWTMLVIVTSFAFSVYFPQDVVENRVSEVDFSQMSLNEKEPKRRKNESSNHINWIMNSGNG